MKPLAGIRIAVTRPAHQSAELAAPLEAAGATVHICPLIRAEPTVDAAQWNRVKSELHEYAWIVFTSTNGVEHFAALLRDGDMQIAELDNARVACVGPATAKSAEAHGFRVSLVPDQFLGTVVADALAEAGAVSGRKILLARAGGGGAELPARLKGRGAVVEDLELYRSVPDDDGTARLRLLLGRSEVDVLTFTSGSAVTYFVEQIGHPAKMVVAVIGPSTAHVARKLGLRVDLEADPHTSAGMIQAITDYYAARRGKSEV